MCVFCVLPAKKLLRKILGRVVKNVLVMFRVTFWGKVVLWKVVFSSFWEIEWKFYDFWQNKLGQAVRN